MTAVWWAGLLQQIAVVAIVLPCAAYSAWTIAPAAWRRPVARVLLRHRWLAGSAVLQSAGRRAESGGCACTGCDHVTPRTGTGAKVIRIVPQTPTTR